MSNQEGGAANAWARRVGETARLAAGKKGGRKWLKS